ncbi:winged helix-turn-helix domain-containing protein [Streptomyces albidoflavus]|uniref:winged helix-turn-helix domain-containing protein n=1 Tax=Streptomyces albidoflavus TaxID=1886 RepID=UPI0030F3F0DA
MGERRVPSGVEQAAVRQAISDHLPCELGLRGQLWTRGQVSELTAKLYRARITEPGVGKYLRRWGLLFQRHDKNRGRAEPEAVRTWLEETWPAIRATAKAKNGEALFADQVGSVLIRSPVAPGARKAAPRSCAAPAIGSP